MIFEELHITAFMGLREQTFRFAPGVNLIEGENESGKSSLAAFVKYLFYGLSGSAPRGTLSEKAKSLPFEGGGIGGSLTLEKDGRQYRIERHGELLRTGGLREVCRIVDLQSGQTLNEEPGKFFFGLPEKLFTRSVYHSGGELSVSGAAMEEAMENLLFSADEELGVRKALKRLDEARTLLLHKNGKGGKIASLEAEEERLEKRLATCEDTRGRIGDLESDCAAVREKLRADSAALAACERKIAVTDTTVRLGLLRRRKQAKERLCGAAEEERTFRESRSHEGFFPTREYEAMLVQKESEYFEREKERGEEEEKLKKAEEDTVEEDGRDSAAGEALLDTAGRLRGRRRIFTVFGGIFLALSAGGGLLAWRPWDAAPAGGAELTLGLLLAAGGLFALSFVFFLLAAMTGRKRRRLFQAWDPDVRDEETLRASLEELREREKARVRARTAVEMQTAALHAAEEKKLRTLWEIDALAGKWGRRCEKAEAIPPLLCEVREALAGAEALHGRVLQAEAVKRAEEGQSGTLFPAGMSDALLEAEEKRLEALLSELAGDEDAASLSLGSEEYADHLKRRNFYKQTTAALREKLHEGERRLSELCAGMEDPAIPRRALEELRPEKQRLRRLHAAYLLAYEKLEEASVRLRERIVPSLGEDASSFLAAATEGRYDALLVDKNLEPKFFFRGETRDNGYFSSGTRVLCYLGLRLAVFKLLFRDRRPPLLFDESFACLDDGRFRAMLRGLRALLEEGRAEQIFLLTSQKRDEAVCGEIFGEDLHMQRLPRFSQSGR